MEEREETTRLMNRILAEDAGLAAAELSAEESPIRRVKREREEHPAAARVREAGNPQHA